MVHDGASPYFWGPGAIPDNPYLADVPDVWSHTPTPYGPAFLQLARWVVDLGRTTHACRPCSGCG